MSDADKEKDIILGFLVVVSALLITAVALLIYCWRQRRRRRQDVEAAETGKAREAAGCTIRANTQPAAPDTVTQGDSSQQTAAVAQNDGSILINGSAMDNSSNANNNDSKTDDRCALSSSSNISSNNINSNEIQGVQADALKEADDHACQADGKMDGDSSLQQEIPTSETGSDAKRPDSGGGGECGGAADTQLGVADHHVYHILEPDFKGKKDRGVLFSLDEQCSSGVGQGDEAGFGGRARSDTSTGLLKASDYSECIQLIDRSLTHAGSASTSHDSAITVIDKRISEYEVTDAGVYEDVQLKPHPLWPLTLPVADFNNGNRQNVTSPGTLSLSSPSSTSEDLSSNPFRQSGYEDIELRPAMLNVNPISESGTHEASSAGSTGVNVQKTGLRVRCRSDGQYEQVGDLLDWKALFALALDHAAEGLRSIAGADSVAASGSAYPMDLPFYCRSQSERAYEQIEVLPTHRLLSDRVQADLPARRPPLAALHDAGGPRAATRSQGITGAYDAIVLHSNLDLPHIEGQSYRAKTDYIERLANSPSGTQNQPSESEPDSTYAYAVPSKLKLKPKYDTAPSEETTQQQAQSESQDAFCPGGLAEHDRSTVPAIIKTVQSGPQTASDSTVEDSVPPDCRVQQRSASEPTAPDIGVGMTVPPSEALDTAGVYVRLRVVAVTAATAAVGGGGGGDGSPEDQSCVKDTSK